MKRLTLAGLVLILIGFILFVPMFFLNYGSRFWEVSRMELSIRTVEDVKTLSANKYTVLDIDLTQLNLQITAGDVSSPTLSYPVVADQADAAYFELRIEEKDSTLQITEVHTVENRRWMKRNLRIRGKTDVVLTLPTNFPLESVDVHLSMGSAKFRQLDLGELKLDLSMGGAVLSELTAQAIDVDLSMGSLKLENAKLTSGSYNLSMGSI